MRAIIPLRTVTVTATDAWAFTAIAVAAAAPGVPFDCEAFGVCVASGGDEGTLGEEANTEPNTIKFILSPMHCRQDSTVCA